jgi:hypothetical protein
MLKKRMLRTCYWTIAAFAVVMLLGSDAVVQATPTGTSIAINFAADQVGPDGSAVTGAAGLAGTENWNNFTGEVSTAAQPLIKDVTSASASSAATIEWASNNTWASTGLGEENNTAPAGNDRNLMTGYLDTTDVTVTQVSVTGLDAEFTAQEYRVAVYINGGVNGRGGQYTITTPDQVQSLALTGTQPFDGSYVGGEDFLVFAGLTSPDFVLTAEPTVGTPPRAPINGIEIVAIPEPGSIVLLAMGALGLLGLCHGLRRK